MLSIVIFVSSSRASDIAQETAFLICDPLAADLISGSNAHLSTVERSFRKLREILIA